MATHKDLDVWKEAIDLVEIIYELTSKLPADERYNLISQMRRCSVSISSNIAEGAARGTTKEYVRFLYISLGSLSELETQVIIVERLYKLKVEFIVEIMDKQRNKLLSLVRYLKTKYPA